MSREIAQRIGPQAVHVRFQILHSVGPTPELKFRVLFFEVKQIYSEKFINRKMRERYILITINLINLIKKKQFSPRGRCCKCT